MNKCYHCGKQADFQAYDDICDDVIWKCNSCSREMFFALLPMWIMLVLGGLLLLISTIN